MVIDPVCGMEIIDPPSAAGQTEYQEQTYYFCPEGCKRRFDQYPERYTREQVSSS